MKPLFVSLGSSCCVRWQLDIWNGQKRAETHLFDWLVTSFATVNKVLSVSDPSVIFNKDTIYKYGNVGHTNNSDMRCSELEQFQSIHDLPRSYTNEQYNEFINKLHRRWYRLIEAIRSGKYIIFIHYCSTVCLTQLQVDEFFSHLNKINNNHNCQLVQCYFRKEDIEVVSRERFHTFNFAEHHVKGESDYWAKDIYDWKSLFDIYVNLN